MEFVTLADGVRLHVESDGPSDPGVSGPRATVVLVHGWTLSKKTWAKIVPDLLSCGDIRVVTYDHRGHGRSDAVSPETASIEQMAKDLVFVLEEVCPSGPVILVGHSLGGMTLLALAEQRPDLIAERVAGMVLVNTSAGGPHGVNNGLPLGQTRVARSTVGRVLAAEARRRAVPKRAGKPRAGRAYGALIARLLTGPDAAPGDVLSAVQMVRETPGGSFPAFLSTFLTHDRRHALSRLRGIPVAILSGAHDRLTPVAESVEMYRLLPSATLKVFPLAGHMLPLERSSAVSGAILDVLRRGLPGATATTGAGNDLASSHGVQSRS